MRNMSFMLTTEQVRNRTKTVTRRLRWWFLKPGELVRACVKCQGLKKGEKVEVLAIIRIKSTRGEELWFMKDSDLAKEGFPDLNAAQFFDMFLAHMKCELATVVNRIEFEYVD